MKNLIIFGVLLQAILFISCESTDFEVIRTNATYVGLWTITETDCSGPLGESQEIQGQTIEISEADDLLSVDFGDDVIFSARVIESEMQIDFQRLNEGQGFDEIGMEGKGILIDEYWLDLRFEHTVDYENLSVCTFKLIK